MLFVLLKKYIPLFTMKNLAFILVFYLVGMMMFPCSDAFNECKPLPVKVASSDGHSHKEDANDNCSPFCNCSCCHTIVVTKFLTQKETGPKSVFIVKKFLFANQHFVSNYHGNIWQPPKINS